MSFVTPMHIKSIYSILMLICKVNKNHMVGSPTMGSFTIQDIFLIYQTLSLVGRAQLCAMFVRLCFNFWFVKIKSTTR